MSGVNILIIEDDTAVALALEMLIQRTGCSIMGIVEDPDEALHFIRNHVPDMVFINSEMEAKSNGEQLLKELRLQPVPIVLVPGMPTNGAAGKQKWRSQVMLTLNTLFGSISQAEDRNDCTLKNSIFLKRGYMLYKVPFNSILYIKAEAGYCEFRTIEGNFVHKITMVKLLANLPKRHFLQIHKGYLIHLQHIEHISLSRNELTVGRFSVPIGKVYKAALLDCLQRID